MDRYVFTKQEKAVLERLKPALAVYQFVNKRVVTLVLSDGFCELIGMDREHAMAWFREGQYERLHPDDVGRVARVSMEFANHRGDYDLAFRTRHPDGYHILHAIAKWLTMPDGTELALVTYADLTANFDAISGSMEDYHLFREDQFYTDPLTRLPNLNYLNQYADERVHALRTFGKQPVIVYADVIGMHYYNSRYGYQEGNALLRLTAESLTHAFPEALVMRGRDDHFLVIDAFDDRAEIEKRISQANQEIRSRAEGRTVGIKAGIIVQGADSVLQQQVCNFSGSLTAAHINNGTTFYHLQYMEQLLIFVSSPSHNISQILPLIAHAENIKTLPMSLPRGGILITVWGVMHTRLPSLRVVLRLDVWVLEFFLYIFDHLRCGRSRQCQNGSFWFQFPDFPDFQIGWTEIVTPL